MTQNQAFWGNKNKQKLLRCTVHQPNWCKDTKSSSLNKNRLILTNKAFLCLWFTVRFDAVTHIHAVWSNNSNYQKRKTAVVWFTSRIDARTQNQAVCRNKNQKLKSALFYTSFADLMRGGPKIRHSWEVRTNKQKILSCIVHQQTGRRDTKTWIK